MSDENPLVASGPGEISPDNLSAAAKIAQWESVLAGDLSDRPEAERCEALAGLAREIVRHFHFDVRPGHEISDDEFVWAVRAADALAECIAMEGQSPDGGNPDPAIFAEAQALSQRLQNYGDVVPGENLTPRRRSRLRARGAVRKPLAELSFTPETVEAVQDLESKLYASHPTLTSHTAEIFATPPASTFLLEKETLLPPAIPSMPSFADETFENRVPGILVPPPTIRLTVTPDAVIAGDCVTISWEGDSIDQMEVWAGGEKIHFGDDPRGRIDHCATDSTFMVELRAWNSAQQGLLAPVTATVEVRLPSLPVIDSFACSPQNPAPGDEVKLWWSCRDADQVHLKKDGGASSAVAASGAQTVPADSTSVWTLTATSRAGTVTQSITITVAEPEPAIEDLFTSRPIILEFRAEPEVVEEGRSFTIYWDIVNAVERTLYAPEPQSVPDKGSLLIENPAKDVVYRLVAAVPRANLSVSKELTVQFRTPDFTDFDESDEPAPQKREDAPPVISPFQFGAEEDSMWPTGVNPRGPATSAGASPPPSYGFGRHTEEEPYEHPASGTLTPPPKAEVTLFPEVIRPGDKVTLSWSAQWTDRIAILAGESKLHESAELNGQVDLYPVLDTTYEFRAWNSENAPLPSPLFLSVRISNEPPASIDFFSADPSHLQGGGEVVLKWKCSNAKKVTLSSGTERETVEAAGERIKSILTSSKWTLTAEGVGPAQSRQIGVQVDPLPPAPEPRVSFYATAGAAGVVRLHWEVFDATEIRIEPLVGPVSRHGSRDVAPRQTTIFSLHASNSSHTVVKTASVEIAAGPPAILSFEISRRSVPPGTQVKLSWSTRGVSEVRLEPGLGPQRPNGHIFVTPQASTKYTLFAGTGHSQRIQTKSIRVSRIPPGLYFLFILLLLAIVLPMALCGPSEPLPPSAETVAPVPSLPPAPKIVKPERPAASPPAVDAPILTATVVPKVPGPQPAVIAPEVQNSPVSPILPPSRVDPAPADSIVATPDLSARLSDLQRELEKGREELALERKRLNDFNASRSALDAQSAAELKRLRAEAAAKMEIAANLQRQLERNQRTTVPQDPPAWSKAVSGSFVWVYEGENRPMFDVALRFPDQSPDAKAIVNVGVIHGDPLPGVPCRLVPDNQKVTTVEPIDTTAGMRGFRFRIPGKHVFKKGKAVVRFYWTRLDLLHGLDAAPKGNMQ